MIKAGLLKAFHSLYGARVVACRRTGIKLQFLREVAVSVRNNLRQYLCGDLDLVLCSQLPLRLGALRVGTVPPEPTRPFAPTKKSVE